MAATNGRMRICMWCYYQSQTQTDPAHVTHGPHSHGRIDVGRPPCLKKKTPEQTNSCPRDWRLSVQLSAPLKPPIFHSTIVLRGLREALKLGPHYTERRQSLRQ